MPTPIIATRTLTHGLSLTYRDCSLITQRFAGDPSPLYTTDRRHDGAPLGDTDGGGATPGIVVIVRTKSGPQFEIIVEEQAVASFAASAQEYPCERANISPPANVSPAPVESMACVGMASTRCQPSSLTINAPSSANVIATVRIPQLFKIFAAPSRSSRGSIPVRISVSSSLGLTTSQSAQISSIPSGLKCSILPFEPMRRKKSLRIEKDRRLGTFADFAHELERRLLHDRADEDDVGLSRFRPEYD